MRKPPPRHQHAGQPIRHDGPSSRGIVCVVCRERPPVVGYEQQHEFVVESTGKHFWKPSGLIEGYCAECRQDGK